MRDGTSSAAGSAKSVGDDAFFVGDGAESVGDGAFSVGDGEKSVSDEAFSPWQRSEKRQR